MIFDKLGLPRDNGATDKQDSARLAGILATFDWPQKANNIYLYLKEKTYVRHPEERVYDFSRDQAIPLMAGLYKKNFKGIVSKKYVDGKDYWSSSQNGHVRRCQGLEAYPWQSAWLWLDVLWACYVKPLAESNQLLCMLMIAPPKYLRFYLKHCSKWQEAINLYWRDSYRKEPELAAHMIKVLENVQKA